jgi:hypothetical protein
MQEPCCSHAFEWEPCLQSRLHRLTEKHGYLLLVYYKGAVRVFYLKGNKMQVNFFMATLSNERLSLKRSERLAEASARKLEF